jgi:hypothetical protein
MFPGASTVSTSQPPACEGWKSGTPKSEFIGLSSLNGEVSPGGDNGTPLPPHELKTTPKSQMPTAHPATCLNRLHFSIIADPPFFGEDCDKAGICA